MKQVFHPAQKWEEYTAGMWRGVTKPEERDAYIAATATLMRDTERFFQSMCRAIREWPISCSHHLSNPSINHQAWLGHAGCCLETGSPEDCTRLGWHKLNAAEQDAANNAADRAYAVWESGIVDRRNGDAQDLFGN